MEKMDASLPEFDIRADINGEEKAIHVKPEETSDGVTYFVCSISGETITQLRKEPDGDWEQMWGDLDQETVDTLGKAIKK